MSTSARMRELYKEIQNSLFDMIPEKWNKIFLYASVIDGVNSLETGEMYFYYIPKGILKREPVNVYEVPNKFNLEESSYFKMADNLYGIIKKLRKEYIATNGSLWTNITISIADCTFKVEYGFENLATSPYSNYDTHLVFRYKYLKTGLNTYSKREKQMVIDYIEREENSNKRIDIYEESIYTAPTKNLVNFEKDAPTKSRKEERMEEIYELEKDSEFWPHDKKYIILESKPKSKNQIINTNKR